MKYKVIKEYDRFYLCESKQGYKECFFKNEYRPDKEGYISKKEDSYINNQNTFLEKKNV